MKINRAEIGGQIILQHGPTFVGLKPTTDEFVDFEFRLFHMGHMAGTGWIECEEVRFGIGERMADNVKEIVEAMIRQEFSHLFPEDSFKGSYLDQLPESSRLSTAEIERTSMWRVTK